MNFYEMIDEGTIKNITRNEKTLSNDISVKIGEASILKEPFVFIIFDKTVKMGTMSIKEGQLIIEAFNYATVKKMSVLAFIETGGIRIEDGVAALMQMARTTIAVREHSDLRLLFISIFGNPSLGGVTASFASLCDIAIALPGTIYGFTGKKIIIKSINTLLPDDFQSSQYAYRNGMFDLLVEENQLQKILYKLLVFHRRDK